MWARAQTKQEFFMLQQPFHLSTQLQTLLVDFQTYPLLHAHPGPHGSVRSQICHPVPLVTLPGHVLNPQWLKFPQSLSQYAFFVIRHFNFSVNHYFYKNSSGRRRSVLPIMCKKPAEQWSSTKHDNMVNTNFILAF